VLSNYVCFIVQEQLRGQVAIFSDILNPSCDSTYPSYQLGNKPERLLELLGRGRRTALIFNAMDCWPDYRPVRLKEEIERLKSIGLEPTEIDLRHYFGKTSELKETLAQYDLIWVRGGNTFVLRRAYRQSGADSIIPELLAQDTLVYGGFSAGCSVLAPSLRGIDLVDDPKLVPDGYNSEIIWEGVGLVPYAIAPHYKSDHPESADIDKSVEYMIDNHMPFIALRDGEVIVINDDRQKVVN
jgi:dipeptidase E